MHVSSNVVRIGLALVPLALLSACASGPSQIQIKFPSSDGRNKNFECITTEQEKAAGKSRCWSRKERTPAQENKGGTLHFIPPDCKGGFDIITVENVDSDNPRMFVVCQPETGG